MSQLHRFLASLNKEERAQIEQLKLIGKEKALFQYTTNRVSSSVPDPEEVCSELDISLPHLYKMNSVLLNKCYQHLVPSGGLKLLEFLKSKGQFVLIRSEARTQEQQLIAMKAGSSLLEKFYLGLFHLFIDFPYKFYDKKLVNEYGDNYLANKKPKSVSDVIYVEYHKLFADVNRFAASKNPRRSLGVDTVKKLKDEKKLVNGKHYLALYYLYRARASWYTLYEPNQEKKLEALQQAINLKDKIAWFFDTDIGVFLELLYADALFSGGKSSEALNAFRKIFSEKVSENTFGYHYFCEQYALLCLTAGDTVTAQKVLDDVFAPCIANQLDIYATRGALAYAKLFLFQKNLREAIHYINIGYAVNEKNLYLPFEVQLRFLESVTFAAREEFDFAMKLCRRSNKFAMAADEKNLLKDYCEFWSALEQWCKAKKKNKQVSDEITGVIIAFSNKHFSLYCGIPEILLIKG